MIRKLSTQEKTSQRIGNLASYLVIAAMMACFSVTVSQLLYWLTSLPKDEVTYSYQWGLLPFLLFLVSLESIFTRSIAREFEGRERILYHAAEWITFAVLCKLSIYLVHGFDLLPLDLPRWQENFFSFFEGEFLFSFLLMLVVWGVSRASANDIEELNVDPADAEWEYGKLANSRSAIRGTLVNRIFWIGLIMVLATGLIRLNLFKSTGPVDLQGPVVSVMIYFFLALALFSQTQYALLRGRWFWHQVPVYRFLPRTWIRYSLVFFAFLAIVSFILPTGYSLGLLETLNYVLNGAINVFFFLMQIIFLPIVWLLSLAGCNRQSQVDATPAPPVLPPRPEPTTPSSPLPWLELLKSIVFWAVFWGIILYALYTFIRQNPQMITLFRQMRIYGWINSLWDWLKHWMYAMGGQVSIAIRQVRMRLSLTRRTSLISNIQRWTNFRQMDDRQRIIFYYLRLLDRGGDSGLTRKPHETPRKYAGTLATRIPEVQDDIDGMTEAFLEARYSTHEMSGSHSSLVQRLWRNISRSLDRLKKSPTKSHP